MRGAHGWFTVERAIAVGRFSSHHSLHIVGGHQCISYAVRALPFPTYRTPARRARARARPTSYSHTACGTHTRGALSRSRLPAPPMRSRLRCVLTRSPQSPASTLLLPASAALSCAATRQASSRKSRLARYRWSRCHPSWCLPLHPRCPTRSSTRPRPPTRLRPPTHPPYKHPEVSIVEWYDMRYTCKLAPLEPAPVSSASAVGWMCSSSVAP